MRILIITVTRNRKGQAQRAEHTVEGDVVRLGRGTQCEIHLPDPRVSLYHAAIYRQGDAIFIQAPEAELAVEGEPLREARLVPGVRVALGPYDLTVEPPPPGCDLALAIERARPMPDDLTEIKAKSRTTLEQSGLSRRTPAWTLAIIIALIFFALPAINALLLPLRPYTATLPITPDQSWNPGPLSAGHQQFGRNCGRCHELPFVHVRDRVCIECHRGTPGHVQPASLQRSLFAGTRCESCHADHKGPVALVRRDADLCVSCHGDLKRRDKDTALANATDFAGDHPAFKLTLWQGPGANDVMRVPQAEKARLVQRPNLRFPHDVHLKSSITGPKGRKTLTCGDCHIADTSGRSFMPLDMKRSCIECHTLQFEPAVTTRQVPHGSAEDAMLTMQEFYANIALNNIPVDVVDLGDIRRGLPKLTGGVITEDERRQALAWAKAKVEQVSEDLFEKRVCIVCHEVTKKMTSGEAGASTTWAITPVHLATSFFPKARFDHASHRTGNVKCTDCHAVEQSHSSADVAMPDIAKCRECHAGNEPAGNRVASTCIACHGFHLPGHPPFGTRTVALAPLAAQAIQ
jgi:predicted CXXCH cytochrome family protein